MKKLLTALFVVIGLGTAVVTISLSLPSNLNKPTLVGEASYACMSSGC
jgi:hypothetical protein